MSLVQVTWPVLSLQPLFERLVKRKWLSNPEPLDQIVELIKDHFKKYQRMDGAPYQLLVSEVHRRVLMEYLRALMRGRIICTSSKMRKRMAGRLREEGQHIKVLFKDLVGVWFRVRVEATAGFPSGSDWSAGVFYRGLLRAGWTAPSLTSLRSSSWKMCRPSRWRSLFWFESFPTSGIPSVLRLMLSWMPLLMLLCYC